MEVKNAVLRAKNFVEEILADEGLQNLGLEEVEFVEGEGVWDITLGFSRPWNSSRGTLSAITGENLQKRAYRVLRIRDADGEVLSMKRREEVE